ncbi:MAG: hypothetical protein NT115_02220, partial [Proteobacteria bacterium]|nr:hypothetical protein [Pseudomonadota bacterium]
NATLIGTCTGSGCMSTSPNTTNGKIDAGFAGGKAMVVNGALTNAVQDTTSGTSQPRSVLFLNFLKCSTC